MATRCIPDDFDGAAPRGLVASEAAQLQSVDGLIERLHQAIEHRLGCGLHGPFRAKSPRDLH